MSLEDLSPEQKQELALGKLAKQLVSNPETSAAAKRLLMKGDPKLVFPEIALEDRLAQTEEKSLERVKALEKQLAQQEAERRLEKLHGKVREAGLELKSVVELMEKHGLPPTDSGYDMAIEVLQSRAQLAEPTTSDVKPFEIPDTKEMWADHVKWREKEGMKILKEIRSGKVIQ